MYYVVAVMPLPPWTDEPEMPVSSISLWILMCDQAGNKTVLILRADYELVHEEGGLDKAGK
jgi:hypothetical protein